MNTRRVYLIGWTLIVLICGYLLGDLTFTRMSFALADDPPPNSGSSEDPDAPADELIFVPDELQHKSSAALAGPTSTLYFFPLDSNNHNTIIFFYNTNPITATVDLDFQTDSGTACGDGVTFDIPPGASARVSADTLDPSRPISWANTVIYNMLDTCEIGLLTMPSPGVQVDGYVAWTADDVYNPRDLNPHAPLRFSTDPHTIHMPTLYRTP